MIPNSLNHVSNEYNCFECNQKLEINSKVHLFACNHVLHKECHNKLLREASGNHHAYKCYKSLTSRILATPFHNLNSLLGKTCLATGLSMYAKIALQKVSLYTLNISMQCVQQGNNIFCNPTTTIIPHYDEIMKELWRSILGGAVGVCMFDIGRKIINEINDGPPVILFKEVIVKDRTNFSYEVVISVGQVSNREQRRD